MDRKGRMKKKNKTLGTERCVNIDTQYINKTMYYYYLNNVDSSENN